MSNYRKYFVTKKWVHDPAARRMSRKADGQLARVYDFLMQTSVYDGWDMDMPTFDAIELVDAARKRVAQAETAAHKAAAVTR